MLALLVLLSLYESRKKNENSVKVFE